MTPQPDSAATAPASTTDPADPANQSQDIDSTFMKKHLKSGKANTSKERKRCSEYGKSHTGDCWPLCGTCGHCAPTQAARPRQPPTVVNNYTFNSDGLAITISAHSTQSAGTVPLPGKRTRRKHPDKGKKRAEKAKNKEEEKKEEGKEGEKEEKEATESSK